MTKNRMDGRSSSRREFLKTGALAAAGLALSPAGSRLSFGAPAQGRPNLLLILMDEMLFDPAPDPEEKRNLAGDARCTDAKTRLSQGMDRVLALPKSTLPRFVPKGSLHSGAL